jgi:hypothetical protein
MTIREEIEAAMLHGASAMFLIGLLAYFKKDEAATIASIEMAAEKVRLQREVEISTVEVRYQKHMERKKSRQ